MRYLFDRLLLLFFNLLLLLLLVDDVELCLVCVIKDDIDNEDDYVEALVHDSEQNFIQSVIVDKSDYTYGEIEGKPEIKLNTGTIAGKGSKARPGVYTKEYRDNFDRIFGHAKKSNNKKEK